MDESQMWLAKQKRTDPKAIYWMIQLMWNSGKVKTNRDRKHISDCQELRFEGGNRNESFFKMMELSCIFNCGGCTTMYFSKIHRSK